MGRLSFVLEPKPPFRLDLTAWAIRRRPENQIDRWDGVRYQRVLAIEGKPVLIGVLQAPDAPAPRLEVTASAPRLPKSTKSAATAALEKLLGLGVDLRAFYHLAAGHPRLRELAARFRGLKPPRFPTVWEGLINGIAGQQFSLAVAILLLNRLAARCGLPSSQDAALHAFPRPEDLAAAHPASLRALGFNAFKSREMIRLGKEIVGGRLNLESFADLDNPEAAARLSDLRGVGRWTAEYVLLRGMGRTDVFPGDDIGARNNLARWLRLRGALDYDRVMRIAAKSKPFGGLLYFHLLLDGLERAGHLEGFSHDQTETRLRGRIAG